MKLETESDPSLLFFAGAERSGGGTARCSRCSSSDESSGERAQDTLTSAPSSTSSSSSIDNSSSSSRHLLALDISDEQPRASRPVECGCGSAAQAGLQGDIHKEDIPHTDSIKLSSEGLKLHCDSWNPTSESSERELPPHPPALSFNSEQLEFIDAEDDTEQSGENSDVLCSSTHCHYSSATPLGDAFNNPGTICSGKVKPGDRHLREDYITEVSGPDFISTDRFNSRKTAAISSGRGRCSPKGDGGEMDSGTEPLNQTMGKVMTGGDRDIDAQVEIPVAADSKELRSVLKKGNNSSGKNKGRVTFDESVTLYSDEVEGVQVLALRSSADVTCPDVFYMFEPPIEYQDLLPFDPPDEYRDPDDSITCMENGDDLSPPPPCLEKVPSCIMLATPEQSTENTLERYAESKTDAENKTYANCTEIHSESNESNTNSPEGTCPSDKIEETSNLEQNDTTEESDRLFERFLEAEREFSEGDELHNVFNVLEGDLTSDSQNGDFDDNFFRKLINLLSSVEGDIHLEDGEFFSSTDFTIDEEIGREMEEDDCSKTPTRNLSEADSDCSISSQDTIIVRVDEEDSDQGKSNDHHGEISDGDLCLEDLSNQNWTDVSSDMFEPSSENSDDVFNEVPNAEKIENCDPKQLQLSNNVETIAKNSTTSQGDRSDGESLSRQSSGEQGSSGTGPDPIQDADDSTSSDSRSGEIEEEIRLDDIGYDEEDADDYDEECLRGMVQGNSKIRRIIKKNALQCSLLRGIEARRRQPGAKYSRPKSPLPSQDSLVEQLKWLTTVDENKDVDNSVLQSKPPDVILSTGNVHLNGVLPHSTSSEEELNNRSFHHPRLPPVHPIQQRRLIATDSKGVYIVHPGGFPPVHQTAQLRQWTTPSGQHIEIPQHRVPTYAPPRPQPLPPQVIRPEPRVVATVTVPRDFRDWRVIQRVAVNRGESPESNPQAHFPPRFPAPRRCQNGAYSTCPQGNVIPPDVSITSKVGGDELEQFVQQDIKRTERIRQRYSIAEDDDDPTFGFARRPSVRGIQTRLGSSASVTNHIRVTASDSASKQPETHFTASYAKVDGTGQGPVVMHARVAAPPGAVPPKVWNRAASWNADSSPAIIYGPSVGVSRTQQAPTHIHRASVALSELPGCANASHSHSKVISDPRYHSYAENIYSSGRIGAPHGWPPSDLRVCVSPGNAMAPHTIPEPIAPSTMAVPPTSLQVPPHTLSTLVKDERGVPEGASSSPKVSSDSLYHPPVSETIPMGDAHKKDGIIYYSLNV